MTYVQEQNRRIASMGRASAFTMGSAMAIGLIVSSERAALGEPIDPNPSNHRAAAVPLPPPPPRSIIPAVALGGVGAVALAIGVGFLVEGAVKRGDARDMNAAILGAHHSCVSSAENFDPICPKLNDTALSAGTFRNAGVGLVIGGSAAAVGAAVYLLWPRSKSGKPSAVRVAPAVSAANARLVFSVSF